MSVGTIVYGACVLIGVAGWTWAGASKKAWSTVLFFLATLLGWLLAAFNAIPNPSLAAVIVWVATTTSLGPTSSMILQVVKAFLPALEDKTAMALSFVGAALLCVFAQAVMPYTEAIPIVVDQTFVLLVWAVQQIWYLYAPQGSILTRNPDF